MRPGPRFRRLEEGEVCSGLWHRLDVSLGEDIQMPSVSVSHLLKCPDLRDVHVPFPTEGGKPKTCQLAASHRRAGERKWPSLIVDEI